MAGRVAIIGAGIAGLSAGCYLRMNGYETEIFELHDKPGGVCTSWTRKGYTFDGCLHWLVGTKDGTSFNRLWRELGALPGPEIVDHEEFIRIEDETGRQLVIYIDPDRLERHLKEISPADSGPIEDMCRTIRRMRGIQTPLGTPRTWGETVEFLKLVPGLARLLVIFLARRKETMGKFRERLKDPFLKRCFELLFNAPDSPLLWILMNLAWMSAGDAGYPVGGSLAFARSIEKRYLELGGTVSYGSRVEEVLVKDGRATGVRLADGTGRPADVVISAADGHSTIFEMLGGRYTDELIREMYEEWPLYEPLVQVSIGVDRDMSAEPQAVWFMLEEPVFIAGRERRDLGYTNYRHDPTLAPEGKSAIVVRFECDYDYWEDLHRDPEAYRAEKERIAETVVGVLERRWPGFRRQVEVVDVATPVTYVRYTGNWRGSYEGFLPDRKNSRYLLTGTDKTLPGLEDFYMIGQWITPGGGLPPAGLHGREVAKIICAKDGRKFIASQPV